MSPERYEVVVSAGSLRPPSGQGIVMPHRWTAEGVVVEAEFTGAHLYLLSAAGCVLNDLYREAVGLGIDIDGVRVRASGGFRPDTWVSTGIEYDVRVDSPSGERPVRELLEVVDEVAEIPKALRAGAEVSRVANAT